LAQLRAETDTGGGRDHVILCVALLGLSRVRWRPRR
jgi:hypothetical protein